MGRFLNKRPTNDDYLSLDRLEDLFHGFKPMLSYLVEDLVYRNKLNEAKGVCLRHGLIGLPYMREETAYELQNVVYDQKKDRSLTMFLDLFLMANIYLYLLM